MIAVEVAKRGRCVLTLGHVAALAGVCKQTVRNAVRQAAGLGLIRSEEWRQSAFRSAPNTITILSGEWTAWLRLAARRGRVKNPGGHGDIESKQADIEKIERQEVWRGENRKIEASVADRVMISRGVTVLPGVWKNSLNLPLIQIPLWMRRGDVHQHEVQGRVEAADHFHFAALHIRMGRSVDRIEWTVIER